MVRPNDEFWNYVEKVDGHLKCKFCRSGFSVNTSISRIKWHLSGVKGHGVNICGQVPPDVKEKAYEAIQNPNKRRKTMPSSSYNGATITLPTSSLQQTNEVENGVRGGEQETGAVGSSLIICINNNNNNNSSSSSNNNNNNNILSGQKKKGKIMVRPNGEFCEQVPNKRCKTVPSSSHNEATNTFPTSSPQQTNEVETGVRGREQETGAVRSSFIINNYNYNNNNVPLMEKSKFEGGPPAVELFPLPRVLEKESIDRTLQEILKCIRNERFHTVGVWGMGGAGKTTAMKVLNNSPEISEAFDIVIWVTVSSQGSVEMVQKRVAERLKLSLGKEESIESRASKISQTLNSKRFLLLLDDVWKMIYLENVGIPYQGNGSKVVLTTRSLTVCNSMETDGNVKVDVFSEEEAWDLFSRKVGDVAFSEGIIGYAKAVVKECAGLPLAIIVLGAALRNTDRIYVWRDALTELQSPTSFTIEGMEDRVFKPLKFSYDHLRGDNMKQCFLYCALYPEDHEINDAELIECWRAEGLTGDAITVDAAYDKGRAILNILVQSSLLEKRGDKYYVMHDVIRDLALRITSPSGNNVSFLVRAGLGDQLAPVEKEWKQMKCISLMDNALNSLPEAPNCPMLSTLLLQNNRYLESIPNMFFKDMEGLRVLDLSFTSITCLPSSIDSLVSLRGLYLNECENLSILPPEVGCLKKLESLQICGSRIKLLPVEIGNLSNLVCLIVSSHCGLEIANGVISKLESLEHLVLDMDNVVDCWDEDDCWDDMHNEDDCWEGNVHAIVDQVASLRRLTKIWLHFPEVKQLEHFLSLSLPWKKQSISTFHFSVGDKRTNFGVPLWALSFEYGWLDESSLEYGWRDGSTIPHEVIDALSHSQNFMLRADRVMQKLSEYGLENLKGLKECLISNCNSIKILANEDSVEADVLPNVEDLMLLGLPNLRSIVKGHVSPRSFGNLKKLDLDVCPKLKYIFSWSMIKQLSKLETLSIINCHKLEDIFEQKKETVEDSSQLPNLKSLILGYAPKLNIDRIATLALSSIEEITIFPGAGVKSLPISLLNAPKLRQIQGTIRWWNEELEWENEAIKLQFQPLFKEDY